MNTPNHEPTQGIFTGHYQFPVTFEVGQHVACIHDHFTDAPEIPTGLTKGTVYTVTEVRLGWNRRIENTVCLKLAELENPLPQTLGYFQANRFRPLPRLNIEDFMHAPAPLEPVGVSS